MQSGKRILRFILVALCFASHVAMKAQLKDSTVISPAFNIDEACLSKSERTPKPVSVYISLEKLLQVETVKQLIPGLPADCEVICVFFSVQGENEKEKPFEFRNIGNTIIFTDRIREGKYFLVDNLVTSCAGAHKANYKFIVSQ